MDTKLLLQKMKDIDATKQQLADLNSYFLSNLLGDQKNRTIILTENDGGPSVPVLPSFKIKARFSTIFSNVLYPINGTDTSNKRYMSVDPTETTVATKGHAVWKKIGIQSAYLGSRTNWFDGVSIFNNLSAVHLDLTINGSRNRMNQVAIMRDMLETKLALSPLIDRLDGNKEASSVGRDIGQHSLTKSYNGFFVLINRVTGFPNQVKELFPVTFDSFVLDAVNNSSPTTVKGVKAAHLVPVMSSKDLTTIRVLADKFTPVGFPLRVSVSSDPGFQHSGETESYLNVAYNFAYCFDEALLQDTAYQQVFKSKESCSAEITQILDDLEARYATTLLAKGIF